jgi:hypothetical protein
VFGYTPDGHYIIVVYDEIDDETVMPLTHMKFPKDDNSQ